MARHRATRPPASSLACAITLALALGLARAASAVPTSVTFDDIPNCDPLAVPANVHELGAGSSFDVFPSEQITAAATLTEQSACAGDSAESANWLVSITNTTGIAWADLWYVADPAGAAGGTSISNHDGFVDDAVAGSGFGGGEAFHIDRIGANQPLVSESMTVDGIFEIGETWEFIVQDFFSLDGLGADALTSVGVASASPTGPPSSGSVIGVAVPEPSPAALVGLGLAALAAGRRRPRRGVRSA